MPNRHRSLSSKDRHELLQVALGEREFDYPDPHVVDIRPLVRFSCWSLLSTEKQRPSSTSHRNRSTRLRRVVQLARPTSSRFSTIGDFTLGDLVPAKPQDLGRARTLFITPESHRHNLESHFIDRSFSPIGRRLDHTSVLLSVQALSMVARRQRLRQTFIQRATVSKKQLSEILTESFREHVTQRQMLEQLKADFARFESGRLVGRQLLRNLPDLEHLVTSSWYQPHVMGVIHEFNAAGLTTVDIQHGQQGPYQSMFVGLPRTHKLNESVTPSEFWVWGSKTRQLMTDNRDEDSGIHVTGYPFLLDTSIYRERLSRDFPNLSSDVLVSLHAPHIDSPEEVPFDIVRDLCDSGLSVQLRQHPNHKLSPSSRNQVRIEFSDSVRISDAVLPFAVVVPSVRLNVSGFSSTTLEAASLGVPSLLWSEVAEAQYADLIDSGVVCAPRSFRSASEHIEASANIDFSAVEKYIAPGEEQLMARITNLS